MTCIARIAFIVGVLVAAFSGAAAANPCAYVGQEICQQGEVYRCETCAGETCPILKGEKCVVDARTIYGSWSGSAHQSPAGSSSDYPVSMSLNESGGSTDYPSLGCGGTLSLVSGNELASEYIEHITYGNDKCIDGGAVTVRLKNNVVAWTWLGSYDNQQYNAIAVLSRQ